MGRRTILKVAGVSSEQHTRWLAAAADERSLSQWMRAAADSAAAGGVRTDTAAVDRLEDVLKAVQRDINCTQVYNNLNQVVHAFHLDRQIGLPTFLTTADAEVVEAVRAIKAIQVSLQKALADIKALRP